MWKYAPKLAGTQEPAAGVALTDSRSVFVAGGMTGKGSGANAGSQYTFLLHLDSQGQKV